MDVKKRLPALLDCPGSYVGFVQICLFEWPLCLCVCPPADWAAVTVFLSPWSDLGPALADV